MNNEPKLNTVTILKERIEHEMRVTLVNTVMEKFHDEFDKEVRPMVEKLTEEIVIDSIDEVADLLHMRNEIRVSVHWQRKEELGL